MDYRDKLGLAILVLYAPAIGVLSLAIAYAGYLVTG